MKKYIIVIISILLIIVLVVFVMFKSFVQKNKINSIKSLEYGYSDGRMINGNVLYKLECDDKCILHSKLEGYPDEETFEVEISKDDYSKILKLLQENKASSWDEFDKTDKHVLDGTSYHFKLVTKEGTKISANGYMKYPKHFKETMKEITTIFDKANESVYIKLFDHDNYKGFDIDNVTKVIDDFYGVGGLQSKEITDKEEINALYEKFNNFRIGIETKMSCEDNTHKYRFIMNDGKEYVIEKECNTIVLDNKRYVYSYGQNRR